MLARTLLFLCTLFLTLRLHAQTVIIGTAKSTEGAAIAGVLVKAYPLGGKAVVTYAQTNREGHYRLQWSERLGERCRVVFSHVSFAPIEVELRKDAGRYDVKMTPQAINIRTVTVKAAPVRQAGDTIVYNVGALTHKADRNIEDVIRRLPGIEVGSGGEIKYQGESINRFYIEGMNLMQGNYGMATRNIRPSDVATVSILERHQPIKALQDIEFSKNAALNLTLKEKARHRWIGNTRLGVGAGDELKALGENYAMQMGKSRQTMVSAKGNNFADDYAIETADFQSLRDEPMVSSLFSDNPFGGVNLPAMRYRNTTAAYGALRRLYKLSDVRTLTLHLRHTFAHQDFHNSKRAEYFGLGVPLVVEEAVDNELTTHRTTVGAQLEHNASSRYVKHQLLAEGSWRTTNHELPPLALGQHYRQADYQLHHQLEWIDRRGRRTQQWGFRADLSTTPEARLNAHYDTSHQLLLHQELSTFSAYVGGGTGFYYNLGRNGKVGSLRMRLNATYLYDSFASTSTDTLATTRNDNRLNSLLVQLTTAYTVRFLGMGWELSLPIRNYLRSYHNALTQQDYSLLRPYFEPSISVVKLIGGGLMSASAGYSNGIGSLRNFITAPIALSYRQQTVLGTGNIDHSSAFYTLLHLNLRDTFNGRALSLNANYTRTKSDWMTHSQLGNKGTESRTWEQQDNVSHIWSAHSRGSIHWFALRTNFALSLQYSGSFTPYRRQGITYDTRQHRYHTELSINSVLFDRKVQTFVKANYSRSFLHRGEQHTDISQWGTALQVSYLPAHAWEIALSGSCDANEMSKERWQHTLFLDGHVRYKQKRWEAELLLRNLANTRSYTLRTYWLTDILTYQQRLRPREMLFTIKWNW